MKLAIFDLDNTLIAGDSDYTWGNFLVAKGIVDANYYQQQNDHFYAQYQQGTLNIHDYQAFVLTPLTTMNEITRKQLLDEFLEHYIIPIRLTKADQLLQQHRDQGHTLMIITATNRFITEPIAAMLKVDHLLATDPEIIDGNFTGKIKGTPCFQDGKVIRLQQWIDQQPAQITNTYFYSDSINDVPLLESVDNPTAVDPDERLRTHALAQHWPIISLRQ